MILDDFLFKIFKINLVYQLKVKILHKNNQNIDENAQNYDKFPLIFS
jgi:hypothetical protein